MAINLKVKQWAEVSRRNAVDVYPDVERWLSNEIESFIIYPVDANIADALTS